MGGVSGVRIVIAGGGLAGSAAALALHKAGFDVSVHEAYRDDGGDIGAFLTLASGGMLALDQIGAAVPVAQAGFELTSLRVTGSDGQQIAVSAMGEQENPLRRYRCIRRAELCAVLRAEVRRRGIPIEYGVRFESCAADGDGVVARFADGTSTKADLVVGADGLHSVVRAVVDPAAAPKRYAGQQVYYGYSGHATPPHEPGRIEMVRGSASAFGYAVSPEGRTFWFARLPGPLLDSTESTEMLREKLVAALRPDATPAAGIVEATNEVLATNAHDLAASPRWRGRGALLVGDAAHAASPATGQGASMAFEDAVVLAKSLRDSPGLEPALDAYERLRRPRVERNIVNSGQMSAGIDASHAERAEDLGRLSRRYADTPAPEAEAVREQLEWDTPISR
ncbi:FAD-dependent monooxygenase [Saccharopolyspora erythraea]|uniref:FAD-dependent oxidoreductase n=1 Tax=Saccharopolyspora erythraea TaxID=1836 RepID=UPI001BABF567|nr:FAD-dependent monooxygenase [Saccharopolyspora erythraea]QUH00615.1 FAD-dependent monooxygenase [Saccharopolyspora erythraea]